MIMLITDELKGREAKPRFYLREHDQHAASKGLVNIAPNSVH